MAYAEPLEVLVIGAAGSPWMRRTTSMLTAAGLEVKSASASTPQARASDTTDVVIIDASDSDGDPLVAAASVWGARPAVPIVFSADELSAEARAAAFEAGIAFVTPCAPASAELVAALRMAAEQNRAGSPELVRAMCRAMCKLSSLSASASDDGFLDAACDEIAALFQAEVVSVMLVGTALDDGLRISAQRGLRTGLIGHVRKGGIAERVARSGKPQIILRSPIASSGNGGWASEVRKEINASMCVPIPCSSRADNALADGPDVRGVINIARKRPHAIFTPRDLDVAVSIAGLIGDVLAVFEARRVSASLQQRMAAVERLSTIGEIAGGIVHEVANPISCVRANVDSIIGYMKDLAPQLAALEAIAPELTEILDDLPSLLCETWEGLTRAQDVIRQMKSLVRLNGGPTPRTERVNVSACVSDTLRMLRPRLGNAVEADLQEGVEVLGSSVELCQVVVNLLVNAADACEERFAASDGDRATNQGMIRVVVHRDGEHAIIQVEDNGIGIAGEQLQRIFLPLFTTKPSDRGTGLGLSIVRRVIEQHGGRVGVSSAPGIGTRFTIRLPRLRNDARLGSAPQVSGW